MIPEGLSVEDFEAQKKTELEVWLWMIINTDTTIQTLNANLTQAKADLEYITHYPDDKIYISLYAEGDTPSEETKAKIQTMRELISKRKAGRDRFRQREIQMADREEFKPFIKPKPKTDAPEAVSSHLLKNFT